MKRIHLRECEPDGKGWRETTFGEATGYGQESSDVMCPEVAYMWNELYPDEEVWVEELR